MGKAGKAGKAGNAADMPIGKIRAERKRLREETEARRQQSQMPESLRQYLLWNAPLRQFGYNYDTHKMIKCTLP